MQTADTLRAFLSIRHTREVPAFFFGLADDAAHKDWINEMTIEDASQGYLDGTIPLSWAKPMNKEPTVTADSTPVLPQLTILTWVGEQRKTVQMPEEVTKQ